MADRYWVAGGTGNYNSTTNWSATSGGASGASVPSTVDNVFFNASSGAGTATINVASNCANLNLTGFTGTLAFTNTLSVNGTILNFGLGTYTITGASQLQLLTAMTITSNATNYTGNLSFTGNVIYTLADNLTISGSLNLNCTSSQTINGNTIFISSNLNHINTGITLGTTVFNFNGTGTWSHTSTVALRNNVTINTAGTLTLGTNVYYNTGTLTYIAGTVVTTGSTLNIGVATTLNTNGITWNNIKTTTGVAITLTSNLTLIGTLSIGNGFTSFVLSGGNLISTNANLTMLATNATFTLPANQTFKTLTVTGGTATLTSNTLTITENLTINNNLAGTTSIIYGGTGTWTALNNTSIINNNFTINTAGTLTISGIVYKGTNTITYTAGTIIDTAGTLALGTNVTTTVNISGFTFRKVLVNGAITLTSSINATTFGTWGFNATTFTLGAFALNFTHLEIGHAGNSVTLPTNWICQNIEFINNSTVGTLNANQIIINGNILQSGSAQVTGTTTFRYNGTGTWTSTSFGYITNAFTINTVGTLTFISAGIGGGIFTYTAGTVITTGSILYIRADSTTMNHGAIVWNNVMLGINNTLGSGAIASITLNNQLICLNTLTLNNCQTSFIGTNATFDTYNLLLGSDAIALRSTTLVSTKTYRVRQSFICTQATNAFRVLLKSSAGASQAIFTLDAGAAIDVGFVNVTDINSSLGRTIYSYKGVFSNTLNWSLLPTDVTAGGGETSYVYVN